MKRKRISPQELAAMKLLRGQGLTYKTIAKKFGRSEQTVWKRLSRAAKPVTTTIKTTPTNTARRSNGLTKDMTTFVRLVVNSSMPSETKVTVLRELV